MGLWLLEKNGLFAPKPMHHGHRKHVALRKPTMSSMFMNIVMTCAIAKDWEGAGLVAELGICGLASQKVTS